MPIYEYQCKACGQHSEFMQKISEPEMTTCPHCNKDQLNKLISASAFHLKGTGWYATDFKTKPQAPKTETEKKTDAPAETKTEAATPKPEKE
jgi:putative FmdB family regulatory protein